DCGHLSGKTEIMRYENLSEITATFPPSFPRKWESRSVGTETYREKRFLYSGLTKTSTALPRLSSKRTIL
ncbi:TPA: hypothetical protein ACJCQ6_001736, partial [Neisseria meningitidis]